MLGCLLTKNNDTLVLAYDTKDQIHNVVLTKQVRHIDVCEVLHELC